MQRLSILFIGFHIVLGQNQFEDPSGNISTRFGGKYLGYYLATLGAAFGRPIVIQGIPIQPPITATQAPTIATRTTLALPDFETLPSVSTLSPFPTAPPTAPSPFPTALPTGPSPFPTAPPTNPSPFPTVPPTGPSPFPTAPPPGASPFPTVPPTGASPFPTSPPAAIVPTGNFPVTNPGPSTFPTAPPQSPFPTSPPAFDTISPTAPSTSFPTGVITSFDQFPTTVALAQNTDPGTQGQDGEVKCGCIPTASCTTRSQRVDVRVVTGGAQQQQQCPSGQTYCCTQTAQFACGFQNIVAGVNPAAGQANLGEFPWAAIIFFTNNTYVGGATIVSTRHIITVAHNLLGKGVGINGFKVRVGEWDTSGAYEPVRAAESTFTSVAPHPNYDAATLRNDIAVVTLATQLVFLRNPIPHVNSICMPRANQAFAGRCFVAGWGRDQFNGQLQEVIKKVDVPIVGAADCQARIRAAGVTNWNIDPASFICAGGEANKDACLGDGGNALACVSNGQFYVAGLAVGGIRCGLANVPGLYTNVVSYATWINAQIAPAVQIVPRTG